MPNKKPYRKPSPQKNIPIGDMGLEFRERGAMSVEHFLRDLGADYTIPTKGAYKLTNVDKRKCFSVMFYPKTGVLMASYKIKLDGPDNKKKTKYTRKQFSTIAEMAEEIPKWVILSK